MRPRPIKPFRTIRISHFPTTKKKFRLCRVVLSRQQILPLYILFWFDLYIMYFSTHVLINISCLLISIYQKCLWQQYTIWCYCCWVARILYMLKVNVCRWWQGRWSWPPHTDFHNSIAHNILFVSIFVFSLFEIPSWKKWKSEHSKCRIRNAVSMQLNLLHSPSLFLHALLQKYRMS